MPPTHNTRESILRAKLDMLADAAEAFGREQARLPVAQRDQAYDEAERDLKLAALDYCRALRGARSTKTECRPVSP